MQTVLYRVEFAYNDFGYNDSSLITTHLRR